MRKIHKNQPTAPVIIERFLVEVNFVLPTAFIDFYKEANGADLLDDESYVQVWPLSDLAHLNKSHNVEEYAPDFFFFGSDGGDTGYAIERKTGKIYEIPFIGMSNVAAVLIEESFSGFVDAYLRE